MTFNTIETKGDKTMNETLNTIWGTAKIDNEGYYNIYSKDKLHRLIYQSVWGKLPKGWVVHHIDGNKRNNCILNLLGIPASYHAKIHTKGKNNPMYGKRGEKSPLYGRKHSLETRKKMSEAQRGEKCSMYGKHHTKESREKISKSTSRKKNTSGYYRVFKQKNSRCKQGFEYVYRYMENGKRKLICSVDITKLKEKVLKKNLEWEEF